MVPTAGTIILQAELRSAGVPHPRPFHLRPAPSACTARPSHQKAKAMRVSSILQGESLTKILQGIVTGAVETLGIGFYWGGLTTND
jgi:hypothetical protein